MEVAVAILAFLNLIAAAANVGLTVWSVRRGRPFAAASAMAAAMLCALAVLYLSWAIAR